MRQKWGSFATGIIFIGAVTWAPAALAYPGLSLYWKQTSMDQKTCLQHAKEILSAHGWTLLSESNDTEAAYTGDNVTRISCSDYYHIVMFSVAGESAPDNYAVTLRDAF